MLSSQVIYATPAYSPPLHFDRLFALFVDVLCALVIIPTLAQANLLDSVTRFSQIILRVVAVLL
ncbi:hypothetical protein NV64_03690 [Erwinia sp. B116]|nr:hypothetical protein ASF13_01695 [Erwinia sp. Leaf53]PLV62963.1 hypothetical protein NV64_03690 [Erwinia sp. B116]